jgi:hypothetical protein
MGLFYRSEDVGLWLIILKNQNNMDLVRQLNEQP